MMHHLFYLAERMKFIDGSQSGIPEVNATQAQVTSVFNGVLMLAGAVAVIFIVLGGIKYSTSGGDPGETKKAKETIIYALVGLVMVILSFSIVNLFITRVF
jgi:hypothetical protein